MTRAHFWPASLAVALLAGACGPQVAPQVNVASAPVTFDRKVQAILRLEDERQLRSASGDLQVLLQDAEARVRRRAALAVGRVRSPEGVPALTALLAGDRDPEVRQMAAFALGLIGDPTGADALMQSLADASPVVQGRAAEALGLIGHKAAATAIGALMTAHIGAGALERISPDDMTYPMGPPVEAVRLGAYALVRLGAFDTLAASLLDGSGAPLSRWWPVAYAFQRIADPKAAPVLLALLGGEGQLTRAFAARGLGVLKQARAVPALSAVAASADEPRAVRIQAARALGVIGDVQAVAVLRRLITTPGIEPNLQLEALTALGLLHPLSAMDLLVDLASSPRPSIRAAALRGLSLVDPATFLSALSSLDPDAHWSVRASLATTLGEMGRERAEAPLLRMLGDADQRVIPAVLDALAKIGASGAVSHLNDRLSSDDPVVRAAAARGLATLKASGADAALGRALETAQRDGPYIARVAALEGLAALESAGARPALTAALTDKDWAVRVRAAELLRKLDPAADVTSMRPAPPPVVPELAAVERLVAPPYSPTAYVDTDKGAFQFELAVIDAPRTVANFVSLVRKGYFNGIQLHRVVPDFVVQDGDPRGDGEGGPGYTIRDEINQRPYLRGTVGMALDWADTGGSQFFITHSPQPHLDGRYTVFGQVIAGMEVVDRLSQWDLIQRIRVWDGTDWIGPP